MRKLIPTAIVSAALALPLAAQAVDEDAATQLHQDRGCVACHAVDSGMVGPSYQDIAERYDQDDVEQLVASVRDGSSGEWGPIAMPPHPHVAEDEIETLVNWILSLD